MFKEKGVDRRDNKSNCFLSMTTSVQNTLWNRYCSHEQRKVDFLMQHECAGTDLIALEEALLAQVEEQEFVPEGAEYTGYGCWHFRGFTIQAIEDEKEQEECRFQFLAVTKAGISHFTRLHHAAIWLSGINHGINNWIDLADLKGNYTLAT